MKFCVSSVFQGCWEIVILEVVTHTQEASSLKI